MAKKSLENAARELVEAHREADSGVSHAFLSRKDNEIRIVEVTDSVGTTNEIIPFRFKSRPDLGVPYPSVIILLSPDELGLLKKDKLKLPKGWGSFKDLSPIEFKSEINK